MKNFRLTCLAAALILGCTDGATVGKPAIDFKLKDLDGKEVSLSSYRGKAVLLNFWAVD